MRDILAKALQLVDRMETCVIGSIDAQGYPAMRAMLNRREYDGMNSICFTTNTSSQHVAEYRDNDKASVYFYDPNLFQGLLLRGSMTVSANQDLRNRLWRDGDNLFYQLGPADPDYSVLLFTASNGRWYENMSHYDFPV